jgi:hypothetical protein
MAECEKAADELESYRDSMDGDIQLLAQEKLAQDLTRYKECLTNEVHFRYSEDGKYHRPNISRCGCEKAAFKNAYREYERAAAIVDYNIKRMSEIFDRADKYCPKGYIQNRFGPPCEVEL